MNHWTKRLDLTPDEAALLQALLPLANKMLAAQRGLQTLERLPVLPESERAFKAKQPRGRL